MQEVNKLLQNQICGVIIKRQQKTNNNIMRIEFLTPIYTLI